MRHARRFPPALSTFGLWAAVLLVLPGCAQILGLEDPVLIQHNLPPGDRPHNAAIFCDIERALGRRCVTDIDMAIGIRLSDAAIALVEGRTSSVGLDDSADALARCAGEVEAVLFEGPFPQGLPVCLNCDTITANFAGDNTAACRAACYDLFGTVAGEGSVFPEVPPSPVVKSFCDARAGASTNFPTAGCFDGACLEGTLRLDFIDPRRFPTPVTWTDHVGTIPSGADLVRVSATGDAGAASTEWVTRGDAYLEFGVTRNHRVGLAELPVGCGPPCTDSTPGVGDITFALDIAADGRISIFARGVRVAGPNPGGFFGSSVAGDRFRVRVRSSGLGATVIYERVPGPCLPGSPCTTTVLHARAEDVSYPLRADASILQTGAAVLSAQLVYIR